jgi:Haem-binding domain
MRLGALLRPRNLLIAVFVLLLLIQLVPVWLFQTNPPVVAEPAWDSPQTRALAQRACFDCHSNETQWPLYSRIAPVSWLITSDVIRGRRLNFSTWGVANSGDPEGRQPRADGQGNGEQGRFAEQNVCANVPGSTRAGNQAAREVQRGSMPPGYYLPLHPTAKLSDAEQQQLVHGLCASLK